MGAMAALPTPPACGGRFAASLTTVLVRGIGDVGSAVAHRLFQAGYVMIHDVRQPSATRRGMAFTDAVFDGRAATGSPLSVRDTTSAEGNSTLA